MVWRRGWKLRLTLTLVAVVFLVLFVVVPVVNVFTQALKGGVGAYVAVFKPQSAFFARFGSAGFHALEELTRIARARDVLVLLDGKRGDIETTGAAYADLSSSARMPRPEPGMTR